MPRIEGTTNAQSTFLRSFRSSPTGPAPSDWPTPAILRRWLRRPSFRKSLSSVQRALHFQADFHLASAATQAASRFATHDSGLSTQDLERLLRLSHLRQRFPAPEPNPYKVLDAAVEQTLAITERTERLEYLRQRTRALRSKNEPVDFDDYIDEVLHA